MTRRPRGNRPPRLDAPTPPAARATAPPAPTTRRLLVAGHVAGPHARLGRTEVAAIVARLAAGHPGATFGLDLGPISRDEAWEAIQDGWGYDGDAARASIAPQRTIESARNAAVRLRAVACTGGRVALATGRPASLLGVYRAVAMALAAAGAEVLACEAFGPFASDRSLWWVDGVAVVTDGASLLADDGAVAGAEWMFAVGRPDLVVADRGFAGAALAAGCETLALADLDAAVLGVAADRHLPACLVPIDDQRPPEAYAPLVAELTAPGPHSTTPAPQAYAGPESGGEG